MNNFVSWAGPHDGVFGVPDLNAICPDAICYGLPFIFSKIVEDPVFSFTIQSVLSFAAYWKDTKHFSTYLKRNLFLAPLNNELSVNDTYRNGIISLNKMLLVDASLDRIVVPRTSPVFQMYAIGSDNVTVPFLSSDQVGYCFFCGILVKMSEVLARFDRLEDPV